MKFRTLLACVPCLAAFHLSAAETWESQLAEMTLRTNTMHFTKMEPMRAILPALVSNSVVQAIIFLPSATDDLYFFDKGSITFTNKPSLLDAVRELTNHTSIHATFRPPLLLLGTTNDFTTPMLGPADAPLLQQLRGKTFSPHFVAIDRDWDRIYPTLVRQTGVVIWPPLESEASWHFYRMCFAEFGLDSYQMVEVISLAAKVKVVAEKGRLQFTPRKGVDK